MEWYEILLIAAAAAFVIGVAVWRLVRKIQGKGGCDCAHCSGNCSSCKSEGKKKKK